MSLPRSYEGVVVAVPVTTERFRTTRRTTPWFFGRLIAELTKQSGLKKTEIDGLIIGSYTLAPDNAASLAEYFNIEPRYVLDMPYGGAIGVMAMTRAARAIQAGDVDVVACMAADIAPSGYGIYSNFSGFTRDSIYPYGGGGANATFALITSNYMREFGAEAEDFGRICVAQRANGAKHPQTLFRKPLTMEEYLTARMISDPLRLFDCVPRVCAGEGFLVMSEDRARALKIPFARIGGAIERINGFSTEPIMTHVGIAMDSQSLYDQAGMGPADMRFVQAYDDYPVIVMLQLEALGFAKYGEAPKLVREKRMTTDGELPMNTHGGMLALGQAGASGGILGFNEALRQVTGRALGAAVPNANAGVVSCFGTVNYDRGVCSTAAILTTGLAA